MVTKFDRNFFSRVLTLPSLPPLLRPYKDIAGSFPLFEDRTSVLWKIIRLFDDERLDLSHGDDLTRISVAQLIPEGELGQKTCLISCPRLEVRELPSLTLVNGPHRLLHLFESLRGIRSEE